MTLNKHLRHSCKFCGKSAFSFFEILKLIDGQAIKCQYCKKKMKGSGLSLFVFQVLVGLIPVIFILTIMFLGLVFGFILSILVFILIVELLAFIIKVKVVSVEAKKDAIDNLSS